MIGQRKKDKNQGSSLHARKKWEMDYDENEDKGNIDQNIPKAEDSSDEEKKKKKK